MIVEEVANRVMIVEEVAISKTQDKTIEFLRVVQDDNTVIVYNKHLQAQ